MVAAQNGNLKMSKLFVYKGANPNHQVRIWAMVGGKFVPRAARGKGGESRWKEKRGFPTPFCCKFPIVTPLT